MYLLNTHTRLLQEFAPNAVPNFAILSHTWGAPEQEATFQDIERGTAASKAGWRKIRSACTMVINDNLDWIWVDTLHRQEEQRRALGSHKLNVQLSVDSQLAASRWFTRGWTLQELLAPSDVIFFIRKWQRIGTKLQLCEALSKITCINAAILGMRRRIDAASVAERMSWASKRQTTRPEDLAYCLMGIFGVNIPLLYGEEEAAFIWLQEEIMKHSADQSLLVWKFKNALEGSSHGLLARHPGCFVEPGNVLPFTGGFEEERLPFAMTNQGLAIDLRLVPREGKNGDVWNHGARPGVNIQEYIAYLESLQSEPEGRFCRVGIYLTQFPYLGKNHYTRVRPHEYFLGELAEDILVNGWPLPAKGTGLPVDRIADLPLTRVYVKQSPLLQFGRTALN